MSHEPKSVRPVAVVTGASQGLGFALAGTLAERGWAVVIDARRRDRLDAAAEQLSPRGTVVAVPGDVTDPSHRAELARAAGELGAVQLLVNNASTLGLSPQPSLSEIGPDTFLRIFEVNVVAPIALVQQLDSVLAPGATVLNITSDAGVEPYEGWGGYGSSKAALEHASRVLAAERADLRVVIVDPGDMRTEMHQDAFPDEDITDREPPEASVPGVISIVEGSQPSGTRQLARAVPREQAVTS